MKPKLKTILLIDDDEATNYIHRMILKELDCTESILIRGNGIDALEYLTTNVDGKPPQPDLIFLDINMPAMDGWEFLDEYNKLNKNQQAKTVIVMLTTSLNPDDREMASTIPHISGYISKPLTADKMTEVHREHFQNQ